VHPAGEVGDRFRVVTVPGASGPVGHGPLVELESREPTTREARICQSM
jgi:hypothetical protein